MGGAILPEAAARRQACVAERGSLRVFFRQSGAAADRIEVFFSVLVSVLLYNAHVWDAVEGGPLRILRTEYDAGIRAALGGAGGNSRPPTWPLRICSRTWRCRPWTS